MKRGDLIYMCGCNPDSYANFSSYRSHMYYKHKNEHGKAVVPAGSTHDMRGRVIG